MGCSSISDQSEKKQNEQNKKIELLEKENKELKTLVQEQEMNLSTESTTDESETVTTLITSFLKSEYNYTNAKGRLNNMKEYMTADLMNTFDNPAVSNGEGTSVKIVSQLKNVEILKTEETSAVVKIDVSFQVENNAPVTSSMLLYFDLEKDSAGKYLIAKQTIFNLS